MKNKVLSVLSLLALAGCLVPSAAKAADLLAQGKAREGSGSSAGVLEVVMLDHTGSPPAGSRYVAVVPEGAPWRLPDEEALEAGSAPVRSFVVPRGRYRLICLATGYAPLFSAPIEIGAKPTTYTCRFAQYSRFRGCVTQGAEVQGVPAARVGLVSLFASLSGQLLSPLGTALWEQTGVATTDATGCYTLSAPAGQKGDLWVEAAGFAPKALPGVVFSDPSRELPRVRLAPGGSLQVALEPPAGFELAAYEVLLRLARNAGEPSTAAEDASVDLAHQVWRRPLLGEPVATWDSLPAGEFFLWLRRRDNGAGARPIDLGRVTISAGGLTKAQFSAAGWQKAARAAAPLRLSLPTKAFGADVAREARLWHGDSPIVLPWLLETTSAGRSATVPRACLAGATLVLVGGKHVSSPVILREENCELVAGETPSVFPAGILRGRLEVARGAALPRWFLMHAAFCAEGPGRLPRRLGDYPVGVAADGTWAVEVPAGCLDLSLQAPQFAPHRFARLQVPERGPGRDLGRVQLSPGAALLVRAHAARDGRPLAGVAVELLAEADLAQAVEASFRAQPSPSVIAAVSDAQGWASLPSLEPGRFALRAILPGLSPAFRNEVVLRAGAETLIDDLELGEPGRLEILMELAEGLRDNAESFTLEATSGATCGWQANARFETTVAADGRATFPEIPAGQWQVTAYKNQRDGLVVSLGSEWVDVVAGETAELAFRSPHRIFRGVVTAAGKPVAGRLRFDAVSRLGDLPTTHSTAGEDGTFRVGLPAPGAYHVVVEPVGSAGQRFARAVLFEDPAENVTIRLPEGRIGGRVVDLTGQGVGGINVLAELDQPLGASPLRSGTQSGPGGHFELPGLAPGTWRVSAADTERSTQAAQVELPEEGSHGGVLLTLEVRTVIEGVVRAGGRPVAGVELTLNASGGEPRDPVFQRVLADENGRFRATLRAPVGTRLNVVAQGSGAPAQARWSAVAEHMVLEIEPRGGRVEVALPGGLEGLVFWRWALIRQDGAFLHLSEVRDLLLTAEGPRTAAQLILPNLAEGVWQLVEARDWQQAALVSAGRGGELPALLEFTVPQTEPLVLEQKP